MLRAFFKIDESFSVSYNTLKFEKLWISKFPSRSFFNKEYARLREGERERDDDDSDDDFLLLLLLLVVVAPLLFYVFVFKVVVLIFEKKYY